MSWRTALLIEGDGAGGATLANPPHARLAGQNDRIAAEADVDTLAPTLIGAAHLLFADRTAGVPPTTEAVRKMVITVLAGALKEPRLPA